MEALMLFSNWNLINQIFPGWLRRRITLQWIRRQASYNSTSLLLAPGLLVVPEELEEPRLGDGAGGVWGGDAAPFWPSPGLGCILQGPSCPSSHQQLGAHVCMEFFPSVWSQEVNTWALPSFVWNSPSVHSPAFKTKKQVKIVCVP